MTRSPVDIFESNIDKLDKVEIVINKKTYIPGLRIAQRTL